ncbi:MAG TPA: apolipoprotein N-acyltransferase [Flavobacteriales bacterium]
MRRFHLLSAVATGVLLALAWPAVGGAVPLIFLAWVPLLVAEERFSRADKGQRPRHFMPFVMLALLVWNLCTTWWLFEVSEPMGTRLFTLIGPNLGNVAVMSLPWLVMRGVHRYWGGARARWAFVVCWIAFEKAHMNWDLSWPWLTLGNVFAEHPQWVQWYEWTGTFGGSLWVLALNVMIAGWIIRCLGSNVREQGSRRPAMIAAVLLVPLIGSWVRYATFKEEGVPVEVVVVQPNIDPYTEKFGSMDPLVQVDRMLAQAEAVITPNTALVLMPETALQEGTRLDHQQGRWHLEGLWENDLGASRSVDRIRRFLQAHPGTAVLTGMSSDRFYGEGEPMPRSARPIGDSGTGFVSYNAALLVGSDGSTESYHKSKLVPGVELMPFEVLLGQLDGLALDLGGTTGSLGIQDEREVMSTADGRVKAAPVICYESIYGDHVAAHVRNGATLITIMTNDAWWGDSPGYKHHLAYGRLRAVETRRDVARSANTGISCSIDQRGDVHDATAWWTPAAFRTTLHARTDLTFFVRSGDLIGTAAQGLVLLLLCALVLRLIKRRA